MNLSAASCFSSLAVADNIRDISALTIIAVLSGVFAGRGKMAYSKSKSAVLRADIQLAPSTIMAAS